MHRNRQFKRSEGSTAKARQQRNDDRRGSAAARGYGRPWREYRALFLKMHPFDIADPLVPATLIDHIIPVVQNQDDLSGEKDPLFWATWNHQPLSNTRHLVKTREHDPRLALNRRSILHQLTVPEDDPTARRNELLTLCGLWPRWIDLETGSWVEAPIPARSASE